MSLKGGIELLNCKWVEGLVKSLIRAVSVLETSQCSQEFGQKVPGNQQLCKRGWWLEHLHCCWGKWWWTYSFGVKCPFHLGVTLWEIGALFALVLVIQALSRNENHKWESFSSHEHWCTIEKSEHGLSGLSFREILGACTYFLLPMSLGPPFL